MKKVKGFTLIELIVVIAIIGVLAAILVPSMMGWVTKSRVTTYNNNASELCGQLQTMLTDLTTETSGTTAFVASATVVYDGVSVNGVNSTVAQKIMEVNDNLTSMNGVTWVAKIQDSTVMSVVLTGNGCKNVGGFPNQCPTNMRGKTSSTNLPDYLDCGEGKKSWASMIY